jgi:hypothetical protein
MNKWTGTRTKTGTGTGTGLGTVHTYLDGAADYLVVVLAVEGQLAAQQQEHDHAHGPQVRFPTVALRAGRQGDIKKGRKVGRNMQSQ